MFEKTTARLDLTTAGGKSKAVDGLLPVIAAINDPIRQAHYLQKLAALVKVDMNTIKASLGQLKPPPAKRRSAARTGAETRAVRSLASHPREEYLLALLLRCPELRGSYLDLPADYFESTENREIYTAWRQNPDPAALKETLDAVIHEHLDVITGRDLPTTNADSRCADCALEMKKQYLRKLAETKTDEAGIEITTQLREVFASKDQKRRR